MECHRCKDREDMEAGKYAGIPFDQTPCAKCQLHEVSLRTMPVNPERPVFVPGGMAPGQTDEGLHVDNPFPEEAEASEAKLPVNVMEELITRLLALPHDIRDIVCWRFMGLSYPEIGRRQGITTAGAEARHRRAMRMFPELRELFIRKTARHKRRHGSAIS